MLSRETNKYTTHRAPSVPMAVAPKSLIATESFRAAERDRPSCMNLASISDSGSLERCTMSAPSISCSSSLSAFRWLTPTVCSAQPKTSSGEAAGRGTLALSGPYTRSVEETRGSGGEIHKTDKSTEKRLSCELTRVDVLAIRNVRREEAGRARSCDRKYCCLLCGTGDETDWTTKEQKTQQTGHKRTEDAPRGESAAFQREGREVDPATPRPVGGEEVSMGSGKFALKGNYLSRQDGLRLRAESKVLSES
jgi:hypothetical protein